MLLRRSGLAGTFAAPSTITLVQPLSGTGAVSGTIGRGIAGGSFLIGGLVKAKTTLLFSGGPMSGEMVNGNVTGAGHRRGDDRPHHRARDRAHRRHHLPHGR